MSSKMRIAYIAHPIGGNIKANLEGLKKVIKWINMTEPNVVPFCPYFADVLSMDDNNPKERERGIKNDIAILTRRGIVDELRLYGPCISKGMKAEVLLAVQMQIPIVCATQALHDELVPILHEAGATKYLFG